MIFKKQKKEKSDQFLELKKQIRQLQNKLYIWQTGAIEPGHFYSPFASKEDIDLPLITESIPAIDLNTQEQLTFLEEIKPFYFKFNFPKKKAPDFNYFLENNYLTNSDAVILFCILLYLRPKRIIEVGSGFSSALMLDTQRLFLKNETDLLFIEPYPERLSELVGEEELNGRLIAKKVQEVDLDVFSKLQSGDILFIDSSHVSKRGSDVNHILFNILPSLNKGVYIHFHDVFYPFDYPNEWLEQGRSWNEAYMVRSFLQYNDHFKISLFSSQMEKDKESWYAQNMPICLNESSTIPNWKTKEEIKLTTKGQSLWLQKVK